MSFIELILVIAFGYLIKQWISKIPPRNNVTPTKTSTRKKYYNEVYLKSDDWKRKRYVVLKRDNWLCVYCGEKATQVHHKKYAKINIGKEPIKWLQSVCAKCHKRLHD